ncbi:glycosyltransferase [Humidisolicoccus flavus]|uniref:glycosyltransferase n=1 Tax=Humidisolicoccus flavus TaxID=3111414 RepID=UPI0032562DAA
MNESLARPMRILIACDTFAPDVNGSAKFSTSLAAGLTKRGHEVHVVASALGRGKQGTHVEEHEGARFTVHRLRSIRYPGHDWLRFAEPWRARNNAASLLDALQPDVVHFQSHIILGRAFSFEAAKRGIRLVGTNHIMFENLMDHSLIPAPLQSGTVTQLWRDAGRIFERCDVVTTPTKRSARFLEQRTGIQRVHAVSCGINADDYTVSDARQRGTVTFVGRVTSEKNIDVLVRAFAKLPKDLAKRLEIVGTGDLIESLGKLAVELGIGDRVNLTGYVTNEELRAILTRSEVFGMPSTAELQSIATMEAMASGLPVVAADAMALPHLVYDNENGYLFTPGDVDDLATKLQRVLESSDAEYERMQRRSLALVSPHDIATTLSTFEAIYRGEDVEDPSTEVTFADSGETEGSTH